MLLKNKVKNYNNFIIKIIDKNKNYKIFNYRKLNKNNIFKKIKKIYIKKILELFSGNSKILKKIKNKNLKIINSIDIFLNKKKNIKNFFYKKNIKIKIFKKNIIKNFKKKIFDLIILNPPYINYKNKNIKTKIKFEPLESLTDFNNGIYFYKKIKFYLDYYKNKFKYLLIEFNIKKKYLLKKIFKKIKIINKC